MTLLIIRNINLGFFEDKRGRTKNNLRRLIIHLPLSKKDFIYAQYMSSLQLFFPAFVLVILSMLFNIIEEVAIRHQFELGIMIIGVCMTYVLISLEKGILTYRYIDPRVREIGYLLLTALWIILNYISDAHPTNFIDEIINNGIGAIWFNSICSMGGRNGIYLIALALLVGHFCHMRLPMLIEKGKINDSVF